MPFDNAEGNNDYSTEYKLAGLPAFPENSIKADNYENEIDMRMFTPQKYNLR